MIALTLHKKTSRKPPRRLGLVLLPAAAVAKASEGLPSLQKRRRDPKKSQRQIILGAILLMIAVTALCELHEVFFHDWSARIYMYEAAWEMRVRFVRG